MQTPPPIEIRNAQRKLKIRRASLQQFAGIAIALSWPNRRPTNDIENVEAILISLVSGTRMARLHEKFCGIRGTTDVLTFQHGEIVISAGSAVSNARLFRTSAGREIQLYILHGLLHLCGHDDTNPRARRAMHRRQGALFRRAMKQMRVNFADAPPASPHELTS